MPHKLILMLLSLFIVGEISAQVSQSQSAEKAVILKFLSRQDMFYDSLDDNAHELNRLNELINEFHNDIISSRMPIYVDGYCASMPTRKENLNTAYIRANRVKSEFIVNNGLLEENFITKNYATAYTAPHGASYRDIVVVTIRIPLPKELLPSEPELKTEKVNEEPPPAAEPTGNLAIDAGKANISTSDSENNGESELRTIPDKQQNLIIPEIAARPYIALKTNLATWAGTIMNAAFEAQVGDHFSVELPVMWCPWHIGDRRSVRAFAIQPEARWWLSGPGEGHFFGVHAHAAWFNVRWKNDRYQDAGRPLLGAGLSYGYLLPLGGRWAGEFTLGAGYANMRYDTFYNINNGARIDTRSRNYWGITRIGISVVYRFNTDK